MAKREKKIQTQDQEVLEVITRMEALGNFFMKEVQQLRADFLAMKPGTKVGRTDQNRVIELQEGMINRRKS